MKKLFFAVLLFLANTLEAQIFYVSSGTDLFISASTIFHADGLTLTPSSNFTLSGVNSITRNSTLSSPPGPTYTSRVYLFGATTNNYSGTIRINYLDAELNGLTESTLEVNNYNGTSWGNYASTTNDATNNYVVSSALTNVPLKEISLAASSAPLPVTWLSFTVDKETQDVRIKWSTAQEINSSYFIVLHSTNMLDWESLNSQTAAGFSHAIQQYSYLHTSPAFGTNYYKIKQVDFDDLFSYTGIAAINFSQASGKITILGNPVIDKIVRLQVNQATPLLLYSIEGKMIWEKKLEAGLQSIPVNDLQSGIYFLKTNNQTFRLLVL